MANGNGDSAYEDFADAARGIKSTGHHVDPDKQMSKRYEQASDPLHMDVDATQPISGAQVLANLTQALADEETRYNEAVKRVTEARNVECGCINRINALQKKIDEHVARLRQTAPRDSDWRAKARQGKSGDL